MDNYIPSNERFTKLPEPIQDAWASGQVSSTAVMIWAAAARLEFHGKSVTPEALIDVSPINEWQVHKLLKELDAAGFMTKSGRGKYKPTRGNNQPRVNCEKSQDEVSGYAVQAVKNHRMNCEKSQDELCFITGSDTETQLQEPQKPVSKNIDKERGAPDVAPSETPVSQAAKVKSTDRKPKFTRDVTTIKTALDAIDLPAMRERFPTVDVNRSYEEFCETCLEGTPQDTRPNPYKYVNFSMAFQSWLRRRNRGGKAQTTRTASHGASPHQPKQILSESDLYGGY